MDEGNSNDHSAEKGIWDYLAEHEQAAGDLVNLLTSFSKDTETLPPRIERHAAAIALSRPYCKDFLD
ncbi:MAG TPA: hypothetical protein VJM50_09240 [Pyrinomonadaceae bacterium]|nr:hypothetical protein [Pyrinomonadaceae bacterium]